MNALAGESDLERALIALGAEPAPGQVWRNRMRDGEEVCVRRVAKGYVDYVAPLGTWTRTSKNRKRDHRGISIAMDIFMRDWELMR